jgi:hypothetical protein
MKIGGRSIIGGGLYFCWISSGFEEFGFGVLVNHCRGHRVAGGFGHGGQDSLRYPRAREPDRLLLAGWVVSRFGQGLVKAAGWARQQGGQPDKREFSIRKRYFIYGFAELCDDYVIYFHDVDKFNLCQILYAYMMINELFTH